MGNYLVVDSGSNLVVNVVSSSSHPVNTSQIKFYFANEKALSEYFKYKLKNQRLPDIGELMSRCEHLRSVVIEQRSCKLSLPKVSAVPIRYRSENAAITVSDRESTVAAWIVKNPLASEIDLSEAFLCGVTVARAYLAKYRDVPKA